MRVFGTLIGKALREQRVTLLACTAMLVLFFSVATRLFLTFGETTGQALRKFPPQLMMTMFGGGLLGLEPVDAWLLGLFVHPIAQTMLVLFAIALTTGGLAGEVDRGTADLFLSLPVPRWKIVTALETSLVIGLALMVLGAWAGVRIGLELSGIHETRALPALRLVACNLFLLYFAFGNFGLLASAASTYRGRAAGAVVAVIVLSFFGNLIANFYAPLGWLNTLSLYHYYRPQPILMRGAFPWRDGLVLAGAGLAAGALALRTFSRRDIATI